MAIEHRIIGVTSLHHTEPTEESLKYGIKDGHIYKSDFHTRQRIYGFCREGDTIALLNGLKMSRLERELVRRRGVTVLPALSAL